MSGIKHGSEMLGQYFEIFGEEFKFFDVKKYCPI